MRDGHEEALVAINGLFLDHPHTGTGVYTREVLSRLMAAPNAGRGYAIVGHPEHAASFTGRGRYVRLQAPLRRRSARVEKVLWEQATVPLVAARLHADLLYSPYFSLPLLAGTRTAVTVHDLIPLLLPEYAPSAGFKAYFRLVAAATRRADAIVTDSRHSAGDLARLLDVPAERIHVVYLGVEEAYRRPVAAESIEALRERLGLPDRFILYLGGTDPRKNVGVLLRALRIIRTRGRLALPLALVAPRRTVPAAWVASDPYGAAARLGVQSGVVFLDWIADEDKPALYAAATAFAYPSRYEGFGLPPLEAMAAGTPVLCASGSSLPEVVGDAAVLIDPDDAEGWADALLRIGADEVQRADLTARGRVQARAFTWENTVAALQRVFAQALTATR